MMKISQILCPEEHNSGRVRRCPDTTRAPTIPVPHRTPSSVSSVVSPPRSQIKWCTEEEIKVIRLRNAGLKWEDVAKELPGRSDMACRLHYQNYLEKRTMWDDDLKNRLAYCYERSKKELWTKIAEDIGIPWKNAEAMHWQIGKEELSARAGVAPFNLSRAPSIGSPPDHRYSISSSNGFMTESSAGSTPAYSPYAYSPSSPYEYQVVPGYPQPMFPATYGVPTAMPVSHAAPENVRAPVGGKEKQRRKQ